MENEVENSKRYYVIMLLCYYVICLSRCDYCESSQCRNNIIT